MTVICDKKGKLHCLWKCNPFSPNLYPLLSEFIQRVFGESDTVRNGETVFLILCFYIDLPPSEVNFVYSALKFISETATRNRKLPVCVRSGPVVEDFVSYSLPNCDLGGIVIRLGLFIPL